MRIWRAFKIWKWCVWKWPWKPRNRGGNALWYSRQAWTCPLSQRLFLQFSHFTLYFWFLFLRYLTYRPHFCLLDITDLVAFRIWRQIWNTIIIATCRGVILWKWNIRFGAVLPARFWARFGKIRNFFGHFLKLKTTRIGMWSKNASFPSISDFMAHWKWLWKSYTMNNAFFGHFPSSVLASFRGNRKIFFRNNIEYDSYNCGLRSEIPVSYVF